MTWPLAAAAAAVLVSAPALLAQDAFKRSDSDRPHAHHLELVDASGRKIDPRQDPAAPFSMEATCKTCHDVAAIAHGLHFDTHDRSLDGRPGEPWILTDARTGTQLPLSHRAWPGVRRPDEVGLDPLRFLTTFGRHLAGGAVSYASADLTQGRFRLSGDLPIDCMVCHGADRSWSAERWAKATADQNFAWASAIAMGIATVDGSGAALPDDADPDALPKLRYDPRRIEPDGRVFFDVVREPSDAACATCHTTRRVGEAAIPRWQHDGDVHQAAGLACVDCHRNGIEHHTLRGYAGEEHPRATTAASWSCRGCHLDERDADGAIVARGGALGAPRARHLGLPPLHLDKLSCTACHSGPWPGEQVGRVQTSRAHALGIPSQLRGADDLPAIAEPVLKRNAAGVIEPLRMMWPSYWGHERGSRITPIAPEVAFPSVRRAMRVRQDLRAELADDPDFELKLGKALRALQSEAPADARAVWVSGGEVWRIADDDSGVVSATHADAAAYTWPIAHDVRPARRALGVGGCTDCHAPDAPFVHGLVEALGVTPDPTPQTTSMLELSELDPTLVAAWEQSFRGRDLFKLSGVVAVATILLVLVLHLLVGIDVLIGRFGRRRRDDDHGSSAA